MDNKENYQSFKGLEHIYLEDSYVTAIFQTENALHFELELVLTDRHPLYSPPKEGEQYCYHGVTLIFPNIQHIEWKRSNFQAFHDIEGKKDYGNIDLLYRQGNAYHCGGDWGEVSLQSNAPIIQY